MRNLDGRDQLHLGGDPHSPLRGQTLRSQHAHRKVVWDSGPQTGNGSVSGGASIWGLFTFGYHPVEEAERRIIEASPPATIPPPPAPSLLIVAADCRSLTIGSTSYVAATAAATSQRTAA
jgi:hypothetical protein